MKKATSKEFKEMPDDVKVLYFHKATNTPISYSKYIKTITDYPEYFKEEIAELKAYEAIPQEVHCQYTKELMQLTSKCSDCFKGKGFYWMIDNQEEYAILNKKYDECMDNLKPELDQLCDKYYKKYGISK